MGRYIQGKDGRFAGSIGNGKTAVPTASTLPSNTAPETGAEDPGQYAALYAAFTSQPATVSDDYEDVVNRWTKVADRDPQMLTALTRFVNDHLEEAPVLYRGVALTERNWYLHEDMLEPGNTIHMPVSSFSEQQAVAEEFMFDQSDIDDQRTVVFILEGGLGARLGERSAFPDQEEWLAHGEFDIVDVTDDPDRDIDYLVTIRPSESGYFCEPGPDDVVVLGRYGPTVVSTTQITDDTRGAYLTGQCFALAHALTEAEPGRKVGLVVRDYASIHPWGTDYNDPYAGVHRNTLYDVTHAVSVSADGKTVIDIDGEHDMSIFREQQEDLHDGTLIVMDPADMRHLIDSWHGAFPQDYDTAVKVARLVHADR